MSTPQPTVAGGALHPTAFVFWLALAVGGVLTIMVGRVAVPVPRAPLPSADSLRPEEAYVKLLQNFASVFYRLDDTLANRVDAQAAQDLSVFVSGRIKSVRAVDLGGTADPTYSAALRGARDAMVAAWFTLSERLAQVAAGAEVRWPELDPIILDAAIAMRRAALALGLDPAEFKTTVRRMVKRDHEHQDYRDQVRRDRTVASGESVEPGTAAEKQTIEARRARELEDGLTKWVAVHTTIMGRQPGSEER